MTIEEFVVNYLKTTITDVPTSADVPHPKPAKFITVEQTGERITNYIPKAEIAIQSWATSRAEAMALNDRVADVMLGMISNSEIMRCKLISEYNFPLKAEKNPRYQSVFEIVYDKNMTVTAE